MAARKAPKNSKNKARSASRASVKSAEIDVKVPPDRMEDFIDCVRRTGKLQLRIRNVGKTEIPPELLAVVDATN